MRLKTFIEDTNLDSRIAKARKMLDELKRSAQRIGASNLAIQETQTGNTWDINGSVFTPFQQKKFRITFEYDQAEQPLCDLLLTFNLTGVTYDDFQIEQYDDPDNSDLSTRKSWIVYATNWNFSTNATFYIKAYVRCQDTGTITAVTV